MEKVDNMQEQMDNFTKEVLTVIKNQMETPIIKKKTTVKTHHAQQQNWHKKRISEHTDQVYWSGQ